MSLSALYHGTVTHLRRRPRRHALSAKIFSCLLDLDELDALDRRLRLFSVDRFNLFSFCRRDRGDGAGKDLRQRIERAMRDAGLQPDGGKILLLTMPRLLGFAFNPLSVFYCLRRDGSICAMLWEVDNTFGERHAYLIPVSGDGRGDIAQSCAKAFYVSPFMNMGLDYHFRFALPDDRLKLVIEVVDQQGVLMTARFLARRRPLTDAELARQFIALPLQNLRVPAGIYWEALKLWAKGVGLRPKPAPPSAAISLAAAPAQKEP